MTQDLKNSLKIIINAYKDGKFTEEEIFTLLETLFDTNSRDNIIGYPYPVYPNYPNPVYPNYPTNPFDRIIYTTTGDAVNTKENNYEQFKTNVTV